MWRSNIQIHTYIHTYIRLYRKNLATSVLWIDAWTHNKVSFLKSINFWHRQLILLELLWVIQYILPNFFLGKITYQTLWSHRWLMWWAVWLTDCSCWLWSQRHVGGTCVPWTDWLGSRFPSGQSLDFHCMFPKRTIHIESLKTLWI